MKITYFIGMKKRSAYAWSDTESRSEKGFDPYQEGNGFQTKKSGRFRTVSRL
ncbi:MULTISPECIES: hypothetical protein [Paenibacillus]|uniref:hypothetical protein n=1 Tax=Paenibacillus TaxID=44249 RepID=UPI001586BBE8|nr:MULTISPECIES: hypothetical protein [Paenibacillus]